MTSSPLLSAEELQRIRDDARFASADSNVARLLSHITALEAERDGLWQPIETAPKDCGTILICLRPPKDPQDANRIRVFKVRWAIPYEGAPEERGWWEANTQGTHPGTSPFLPEHAIAWMPLPTPPLKDSPNG